MGRASAAQAINGPLNGTRVHARAIRRVSAVQVIYGPLNDTRVLFKETSHTAMARPMAHQCFAIIRWHSLVTKHNIIFVTIWHAVGVERT